MTTPLPIRLVPITAEGLPAEPLLLSELADHVCQFNAAYLAEVGYAPPWIAYLAVCTEPLEGQEDVVVGTCAFKGPPRAGADGRPEAELAYFTFEDYEGRGVGGAMAAALVALGRSADASVRLIAHTLRETNASTRILTRLGLVQQGTAEDDEVGTVWRWHLPD